MNFKTGAEVFSCEDKKVGNIKRVVLNPQTDEVSNLVVEKGFLFTTDKVLPIEWVNRATEEKVTLKETKESFEDLPDFEENLYLPVDWHETDAQYVRSSYWYPTFPFWGRTGAVYAQAPVRYVSTRMRNIPEDSIALEEGAKVYDRDEEHLGDIEQVLVNEEYHTASHIVVEHGLFEKTRKLIPTFWIKSVNEDGVYLSIAEDLYENLPEYESD